MDWIKDFKGNSDEEIKQLLKNIVLTKVTDEEQSQFWIKHAIDIFINKKQDEPSEEMEFALIPTSELKKRMAKFKKED